jgi:hypothetical protein
MNDLVEIHDGDAVYVDAPANSAFCGGPSTSWIKYPLYNSPRGSRNNLAARAAYLTVQPNCGLGGHLRHEFQMDGFL